jgi:hypothetical protein
MVAEVDVESCEGETGVDETAAERRGSDKSGYSYLSVKVRSGYVCVRSPV